MVTGECRLLCTSLTPSILLEATHLAAKEEDDDDDDDDQGYQEDDNTDADANGRCWFCC